MWCHRPGKSVKRRSSICTSFFFTNSRTAFASAAFGSAMDLLLLYDTVTWRSFCARLPGYTANECILAEMNPGGRKFDAPVTILPSVCRLSLGLLAAGRQLNVFYVCHKARLLQRNASIHSGANVKLRDGRTQRSSYGL